MALNCGSTIQEMGLAGGHGKPTAKPSSTPNLPRSCPLRRAPSVLVWAEFTSLLPAEACPVRGRFENPSGSRPGCAWGARAPSCRTPSRLSDATESSNVRLERGQPVAGGSSVTNRVGTADKKGRGERERSKGGRAITGGTPTGGLGSI